MARNKPVYGVSTNNIPYVKWGSGIKRMIIFAGGPGNSLPTGTGFRIMTKSFDNFIDEYTLYFVTRKMGQPAGYTTRDMAGDYAQMISIDLGGYAEAVVGMSFGGMIAQHFAADYPELYGHLVIAMAAHRMSEKGKLIDYEFAELLHQGKIRKAAAAVIGSITDNRFTGALIRTLSWIAGGAFMKGSHEAFKSDVLIEAEAELSHQAVESLGLINKPVLLICGTADIYFPQAYIEETAALIPRSVLKLYEGKGHMNTMTDKRFYKDVKEFLSKVS